MEQVRTGNKWSYYLLLNGKVAFLKTYTAKGGGKVYARRIFLGDMQTENPKVKQETMVRCAAWMLEVLPDQQEEVISTDGKGKSMKCTRVRWRTKSLWPKAQQPAPAPCPRPPLREEVGCQQPSPTGSSSSSTATSEHIYPPGMRLVKDSKFTWVCGGIGPRTHRLWHLCYMRQPAYTMKETDGVTAAHISPKVVKAKLGTNEKGEIDMGQLEERLKPSEDNEEGIRVLGRVAAIRMKWVGKRSGRRRKRSQSALPEARQTSLLGSQLPGQGGSQVNGEGKRSRSHSQEDHGLPLPFPRGFSPGRWVREAMGDRRDYPGTLGQ